MSQSLTETERLSAIPRDQETTKTSLQGLYNYLSRRWLRTRSDTATSPTCTFNLACRFVKGMSCVNPLKCLCNKRISLLLHDAQSTVAQLAILAGGVQSFAIICEF